MASETLAPEDAKDPYMPDFNADPAPRSGEGLQLLSRSVAEFFGTFILIFATVMILPFFAVGTMFAPVEAGSAPVLIAGSQLGLDLIIAVGIVVGLALVGAMAAFSQISGGHFNPALTLAAAAAGRMSWAHTPAYIVAQILGALTASSTALVIFNSSTVFTTAYSVADQSEKTSTISETFSKISSGFGEASPFGTTEVVGALVIIGVLSLILALVYLGATDPSRRMKSAPIAVGVTYGVLFIIAIPFTNGGLNPTGAAATALYAGFGSVAMKQLWLFWVAPIVGALIAGFIFPVFTGGRRVEDEYDWYEDDEDGSLYASGLSAEPSDDDISYVDLEIEETPAAVEEPELKKAKADDTEPSSATSDDAIYRPDAKADDAEAAKAVKADVKKAAKTSEPEIDKTDVKKDAKTSEPAKTKPASKTKDAKKSDEDK